MFLHRIGKKTKIADLIVSHFPPHSVYLEPFFGAGGLFFNKYPISKTNILNDLNSDISNLFNLLISQDLIDLIELSPYHQDVADYLEKNTFENNPTMRALKFLYASNYSVFGMGKGLRFGDSSSKQTLIDNIKKFLKSPFVLNTQFTNCDFRKFLDLIAIRVIKERNKIFMYCDPPYFETNNVYGENFEKINWTEKDVEDLFNFCVGSEVKFAISEFDHPLILKMAENHKLNIIFVCDRHNFQNRRNEILITNYHVNNLNNFIKNIV